MTLTEQVHATLRAHFTDPADQIAFEDEKGDGRHFIVRITSEKFTNLNRIARSRIIYDLLAEFLKKDHIHALRMQLKTPHEL
ncbi:BolA family transcriptional regulator [Candidatus Gracilibacteria bacterium]|nr:BolA family transcriptional regulator [Candidatus Gracilibacteria bacterium]